MLFVRNGDTFRVSALCDLVTLTFNLWT